MLARTTTHGRLFVEAIRGFWAAAPDGLLTVTEQGEVGDRVVARLVYIVWDALGLHRQLGIPLG